MAAPDVCRLAERFPAARPGAARYVDFTRYLTPQQSPRRMRLQEVFEVLANPTTQQPEV